MELSIQGHQGDQSPRDRLSGMRGVHREREPRGEQGPLEKAAESSSHVLGREPLEAGVGGVGKTGKDQQKLHPELSKE